MISAPLQARDRADERELDLEGQAGGAAVDVVLVGVPTLRLQEKLMALLIGEADHLVLQGWAIARADAFDPPAVEGRLIEIGADDFMRGWAVV